MKSLFLGSILFSLIAVFAPLEAAYADNKVTSERYKISVDMPEGRWQKAREGYDSLSFGRYNDKRNSAHIAYNSTSRKPGGFDQWVEDRIGRSLRQYSGEFSYSVLDDDEHQVTLGSGEKVTFHILDLEINGNFRTVSYLSFTYQDGVRYFYAFSWPQGDRAHKKEDMVLFAKNINLL